MIIEILEFLDGDRVTFTTHHPDGYPAKYCVPTEVIHDSERFRIWMAHHAWQIPESEPIQGRYTAGIGDSRFAAIFKPFNLRMTGSLLAQAIREGVMPGPEPEVSGASGEPERGESVSGPESENIQAETPEHSVTLIFNFGMGEELVIDEVERWRYQPEHFPHHPAEWVVKVKSGSHRAEHFKIDANRVQFIHVMIFNPPPRG